MIRLVFALHRKHEFSRESFQAYWRNQHAPLVASFAHDLNILRYVQTHALPDASSQGAQTARGNMEPGHDGVAELWWESEAALQAALTSEAGQSAAAALLEDEAKFIDLPRSPLWFAYEYPQINPSPETISARVKSSILRVFYPLRHQTTMSEAQARHYWLTHHGPIVRSHGETTGTLCYRQVHRADAPHIVPLTEALREARGTEVESYLGHAEAWFDSGRPNTSPEAKAANAAFIEDEHNFIDMSRSTIWLGKELTVIDRR